MKTVTVIGCGAIGIFYGVMLQKAGLKVQFLLRSDYEVVKNQGFRVISKQFGDFNVQADVFNNIEDLEKSDLVLIGLKTTANDYLKQVLPDLLNENTYALTLQNGLGNEELLAEIMSPDRIIGAVAFVCLNRIRPGVVEHTSFGHLKAGGFAENFDDSYLENIKEYFALSGIDFQLSSDMTSLKWEKLIWNVPFNGLSASLGGVDTKAMLDHIPTKELIEELMKEVVQGAATQGISLSVDLIRANIDKTFKMGPYLTSMCLDYQNKKPVEVESIIGEPLRKVAGKADLPYMKELYAHLSFYNNNIRSF